LIPVGDRTDVKETAEHAIVLAMKRAQGVAANGSLPLSKGIPIIALILFGELLFALGLALTCARWMVAGEAQPRALFSLATGAVLLILGYRYSNPKGSPTPAIFARPLTLACLLIVATVVGHWNSVPASMTALAIIAALVGVGTQVLVRRQKGQRRRHLGSHP
jgi:hypothetical protein